MKMTKSMGLALSLATASLLTIVGCGGSSSNNPSTTLPAYNGKFIDSAVGGVSFTCGTISGITQADGTFGTCPAGSTANFRIGSMTLGSSTVTADGIFFVTDLVGVSRADTSDANVLKIATLLQSLDSDGDPSNGVNVPSEAAALFTEPQLITNLSATEVAQVRDDAVAALQTTYPSMQTVTVTEAKANLDDSLGDILDGTITPPPLPTGSGGGN